MAFPFLQTSSVPSGGHDSRLFYYVFDLLYLNGWDLRPCALIDRKQTAHASLGLLRGALSAAIGTGTDQVRAYLEARQLPCVGD